MKKFRLTVALLLIVSLTLPLVSSPASAEPVSFGKIVGTPEESITSVISSKLQKYMSAADENELIPVTIQIRDSIDLNAVEQKALTHANVSKEQLEMLSTDTFGLSEKENEAHQRALLEVQDKISSAKNAILKEYYLEKNGNFIAKNGLSEEKIGSISIFSPFIRKVLLTREQIETLAANEEVCYMEYVGDDKGTDFADIDDTYQIINGDVCVNSGYTGVGIRVGLVEEGHPISYIMGADYDNITITDPGVGANTAHATKTSGIIVKMAPDCSIYSRSAGGLSDAIVDCEYLIDQYNVHVINISYGQVFNGEYDIYSVQMDYLVKNNSVTIVIAAGNDNGCVNSLGLAPNVITVGAVTATGTNQAASGAYTLTDYSPYIEAINVVNKPDVCAPGNVNIYLYNESTGTSFAAPHVTGTVVQMMSRNVGLSDKPQTLKAILMASASYNAGSDMTYTEGTRASDQEGAGVIDAGFCYQVASNGRRTHFDATESTSSFSYNIYCDTTTVPFRIACAWDVFSEQVGKNQNDVEVMITDFDMYIYKNGVPVASSIAYSHSHTAPKTNYEIIEISPSTLAVYGAGYYQVQIVRKGDHQDYGTVRIGLAWEQR